MNDDSHSSATNLTLYPSRPYSTSFILGQAVELDQKATEARREYSNISSSLRALENSSDPGNPQTGDKLSIRWDSLYEVWPFYEDACRAHAGQLAWGILKTTDILDSDDFSKLSVEERLIVVENIITIVRSEPQEPSELRKEYQELLKQTEEFIDSFAPNGTLVSSHISRVRKQGSSLPRVSFERLINILFPNKLKNHRAFTLCGVQFVFCSWSRVKDREPEELNGTFITLLELFQHDWELLENDLRLLSADYKGWNTSHLHDMNTQSELPFALLHQRDGIDIRYQLLDKFGKGTNLSTVVQELTNVPGSSNFERSA
ncbi:hypothetical protein SISSUDRAFT_1121735 [Sistotremastrum suecicum HHB10207 ss-3]|uniref:Uncharacterized protein n=1 Tax=Sistotremastrum suecicum HHB10207 ss-3 TaxID=1314776 RepID=A0A166ADX2_9AGAM|nr:hypothetical protein SISSUDRAFT_1121735 [Sistotremastrum suecicum HHB10207 ss-3]